MRTIFAAFLFFAPISAAQDIEATVKISSSAPAQIEGRLVKENLKQTGNNWTFLNSIAGTENLGSRISNFTLSDEKSRPMTVKKLIEGEYLAEAGAQVFQYEIDLKPLPNASSAAHVSWLTDEVGIVMLGDLLPRFIAENQTVSARIKFDLPSGWLISSGEKRLGENVYETKNIEKAIFLIGRNWRTEKIRVNSAAALDLTVSGEWQFSDAEAVKMAGEVYEEYQKLFGESPVEKAQIFLLGFPKQSKFGRWTAETRGANVTIVSGDMPFKSQSLQRLHEQLRHELFHLWTPNNLALAGNYDWFYEGFTIYQALRTGVMTNQIRFEDFLETLAQAYNLDNFQEKRNSLIESSKNRWNGANTPVYARGMLTAFMCDVALLRQSNGKRAISTLLREIYQKHRVPNKPEEGNAAVLNVFNNYPELNPVIEKYIVGAEKINWETNLESLGIEAKEENLVVRLQIKARLNGKQKDLLNKLGYNNWRKTSEKRK